MSPACNCSTCRIVLPDAQIQLDVGIALAVLVDDRAGDPAGQRPRQRQPQRPALPAPGRAHDRRRVIGRREHAARLAEQRRARRRQRRPAAVAVEQRHAELGLERPHLLRHARLRHVQPLGRAPEVQLLRHRDERAQLAELHRRMIGAAFHRSEHSFLIAQADHPYRPRHGGERGRAGVPAVRHRRPVRLLRARAHGGAGLLQRRARLLGRHRATPTCWRSSRTRRRSRRRTPSSRSSRARLRSTQVFADAGVTQSSSGLSAVQPPDHTRLRGFIKKAFTPRRIALLEPDIRAMTMRPDRRVRRRRPRRPGRRTSSTSCPRSSSSSSSASPTRTSRRSRSGPPAACCSTSATCRSTEQVAPRREPRRLLALLHGPRRGAASTSRATTSPARSRRSTRTATSRSRRRRSPG